MPVCKQCGDELADGASFCASCGAATADISPAPPEKSGEGAGNTVDKVKTATKRFLDTPEITESIEKDDASGNKLMGILCYIGILVIIPWLVKRDSKFVQFHANQGILLLILWIAVGFIWLIPVVKWIVCIVTALALCACIVFGIMGVVKGKAKQLPLIGKIQLID